MKEKLLSRIAERKITVASWAWAMWACPCRRESQGRFQDYRLRRAGRKVNLVNAGHNYIGDVVDAELAQLVRNGTLSATSDFPL